jgi:hypothetical protein
MHDQIRDILFIRSYPKKTTLASSNRNVLKSIIRSEEVKKVPVPMLSLFVNTTKKSISNITEKLLSFLKSMDPKNYFMPG